MMVPVRRWGTLEVGKWVSAVGFPQYRRRFIHQGVAGQLLLDLKSSHLKVTIKLQALLLRIPLLSTLMLAT